MVNPRGPNASVRGIPEEKANALMLEALATMPTEDGGRLYSREAMRQWAAESARDLTDGELEGLMLAFERLPGAFKDGEGKWWLPYPAAALVRNRSWELHLGKVKLPAAMQLHDILSQYAALDPQLSQLLGTLRAAVQPLRVEGGEWEAEHGNDVAKEE